MQTIEIKTAQNVTIEYELAALRERILAYFLDGILYVVVWLVFYIFMLNLLVSIAAESVWVFRILSIAFIGGWMIYHLLFELFRKGQSIGKKVLGIRVVRVDGKEPGFSDYLLRAIFHIVDTMFSFGVVGSILIASSEKRQRFGDLAANTGVVRVQSNTRFQLQDILGIQTLESYQPQYPEVRKLKESEMLLIKTAINRYHEYPNDAHEQALELLIRKIADTLDLKELPEDPIAFLKTLIRDYIVLTR